MSFMDSLLSWIYFIKPPIKKTLTHLDGVTMFAAMLFHNGIFIVFVAIRGSGIIMKKKKRIMGS